MKKITLFIFILSLGLYGCKNNEETYHLSGEINGLGEAEMILEMVTFQKIESIDSTHSDAEGNFEFVGKVSEPGFYRITAKDKYWMLRLENEELVYNAKFDDDLLTETEVLKSENAIAFQEVINYFIAKQNELNAFGQQFQAAQMAGGGQEELMAIEQKFMAAEKAMKEELKTKIASTSDPITGMYMLSAFKTAEDLSYVKEQLENYAAIFPNSTYLLEMREQIKANEDAIAQQKAMEAASQVVAIGSEAPEIVQKNPQGTEISLSSLRGQVVLIDFWASWCKPCRMENPNVVAAYNKFKDKGFTVYSISLDKERDAWINAINQDGLIWGNHVSDLQFWNNTAARSYGVNSIPAAFLIDENGVIIGKDLRGNALEAKLKEVLG